MKLLAYLLTVSSLLGDTISWSAADPTPAGTSPAITGYEVWEKVNGVWELDQTLGNVTTATVTPEAGNPTGKFAVRALWSGGRSGLSDPIETNGWLQNLPTPDGTNTVNPAMSQVAIQAVLDAAMPGDVIYFAGGTYQHNPTSTYLYAGGSVGSIDGTEENLITLMPLPGETAILQGVITSGNNQWGLVVTGDFWRVYGMRVTQFGEFGLRVTGEKCEVVECRVYKNRHTNINLGSPNKVFVGPELNEAAGSVARYCESTYSEIGSGFGFGSGNNNTITRDHRFIRNLSYGNGFNPPIGSDPPRMNLYGGGNSDGVAGGRTPRNVSVDGDAGQAPYLTEAWSAPTGNTLERNHWLQNMFFGNADDGMDTVPGHMSRIVGNFIFQNTPAGGTGFKSVADRFGRLYYVGNTTFKQLSDPAPDDTLYMLQPVLAPQVGDVIVGTSSGAFGTVTSYVDLTGSNGDAEAVVYLSNVSGNWSNNEDLTVNSVFVAKSLVSYSAGGTFRPDGRTLFFHQGLLAPTAGTTLWIGGVTVWHAGGVKIRSGSWAGSDAAGWMRYEYEPVGGAIVSGSEIRVGDSNGALIGVVYGATANTSEWGTLVGYPTGETYLVNNTSLRAGFSDRRSLVPDPYGLTTGNITTGTDAGDLNTSGPPTVTNNLLLQTTVEIVNTNYDPQIVVPTGGTVEERWRTAYREHAEQMMPVSTSNLLDDVPVNTEIHHSTAADDPTAPSDPEDLEKLHWYGAAPDMGAVQFTEYWPPVVSVGGAGGGPGPHANQINAGTLKIEP